MSVSVQSNINLGRASQIMLYQNVGRALRILACAGVVFGAVAQISEHARPRNQPHLALTWTAQFTSSGSAPIFAMHGTYFYDRVGQRSRQTLAVQFDFMAPDQPQPHYDILSKNVGGLNRNITVGEGMDAVCRPAHKALYIDAFDGLTSGRWMGSRVIDAVPCEVWSFNSTDGFSHVSVCLAADGIPREMNTTADMISGVSQRAFPGTTRYVFTNVQSGAPDETFVTSKACSSRYPTPPCPGNSVSQLDLYRIHGPEEPVSLANRNVGDALGDMFFMCEKSAASKLMSKSVTHWQVWANASWGQYNYCFFTEGRNVCLGSSTLVGRQSSWGLGRGHVQGQCSNNTDVGSWYSFPSDGECGRGQSVGVGGCTWGGATALRTVAARCILEDRGLLEVCASGSGSHSRSVEVLKAALASDDPTKGGCPDVRMFQTVVHV